MSCTVAVRLLEDVAVVDLAGKFTLGNGTGVIRETVVDLIQAGYRKILLNLADVTYLDSAAGIGGLVAGYIAAMRQGARLKLLRPGKYVRDALRITGLDRVFEIHDHESAALRSFAVTEAAAAP
ncbi:MAG TPA: STAS domain-containing protein [Bryobacteraceae bacterium]|jgi:anti-sigma B factor antagonist|nr:STAS domain-containing protein [Bryobacteraceae bacterium]